ncbi:MAG: hypothetical protein EXQ90_04375 [Rhodospirillales bacterium]|nr:hypothetical protein [Rhodospirillales bacterium]
MKRWAFPLLAIAVAIAALVAFGEVAVRILAPQNLSGTWFDTGPRGLVLNRADWQARHQQLDRIVTYLFNSLHHRGGEPAADVPRVLVLGNSFTFGWLLEEAATVPEQLQIRADADLGRGRAQFLNAATGGWELASYAAYLETFGDQVKPAAVAVFVTAGDFPRASESGLYDSNGDGTLRPIAAPEHGSWTRAIARSVPGYEWLLENSHLIQIVRQRFVRLGQGEDPAATPGAVGWNSFSYTPTAEHKVMGRALLARIKSWCDARRIPLLLVTHYHYNHPTDIYQWLAPVTAELGIPFLDLQPGMTATVGPDAAPYFLEDDPHPNERNNALFAERAWQWMKPTIEAVARRP